MKKIVPITILILTLLLVIFLVKKGGQPKITLQELSEHYDLYSQSALSLRHVVGEYETDRYRFGLYQYGNKEAGEYATVLLGSRFFGDGGVVYDILLHPVYGGCLYKDSETINGYTVLEDDPNLKASERKILKAWVIDGKKKKFVKVPVEDVACFDTGMDY